MNGFGGPDYCRLMLSNEFDPKVNEAPTPEDRLELFSDVAHSYEKLTRELRRSDQVPDVVNAELVEGRLLRAALLRKFYVSGEQVQLERIVDAVEMVVEPNDRSDHLISACDAIRNRFQIERTSEEEHEGFQRYSAKEAFRTITYGLVLHADYGKWRQLRGELGSAMSLSLSLTVARMEALILGILAPVDAVIGVNRGDIYVVDAGIAEFGDRGPRMVELPTGGCQK